MVVLYFYNIRIWNVPNPWNLLNFNIFQSWWFLSGGVLFEGRGGWGVIDLGCFLLVGYFGFEIVCWVGGWCWGWGILVQGSRGALQGGGGGWVGGDVGGILFGGLCISDNIDVI